MSAPQLETLDLKPDEDGTSLSLRHAPRGKEKYELWLDAGGFTAVRALNVYDLHDLMMWIDGVLDSIGENSHA